VKAIEDRIVALEGAVRDLRSLVDHLSELVTNEATFELLRQMKERDTKRNRSSATVREMTDDDARTVLAGEHRELGHKAAALAIGLTYSQVYSCRMGYTFKHIRKELRDAGVKTAWL